MLLVHVLHQIADLLSSQIQNKIEIQEMPSWLLLCFHPPITHTTFRSKHLDCMKPEPSKSLFHGCVLVPLTCKVMINLK